MSVRVNLAQRGSNKRATGLWGPIRSIFRSRGTYSFMTILYALGRGGAVIGLILLVVALLKQLIIMMGFLLALVKFAIIIAFVAVLVMIALAIFRDRSRRRREAKDI